MQAPLPKVSVQRLKGPRTQVIDVLCLDELHPVTGGNKLFKLRYNLIQAQASPHRTILTFGGPHSNHIVATAQACREAGLSAIGVIRGREQVSPTLEFAAAQGMRLEFVESRQYRQAQEPTFLRHLREKFGDFLAVPEGGSNEDGLRGCAEIIPRESDHDYVLCACGTGTTFGGLLLSHGHTATIIGVSVLKGPNRLPATVMALLRGRSNAAVGDSDILLTEVIRKHGIITEYSLPGYARLNPQVAEFKSEFEEAEHIKLDHIYTARLFYAAYDLCAKGKIPPGAKVLLIHSGGLQGNAAFEARYGAAACPAPRQR